WATVSIGLNKDQVFLLPNIIIRKEIKHRNVLETSTVKILLVSNFREAKNHAYACTMLASLKTRMNFTASFVGQIIDPVFMKDIQNQIKINQLDDIITVVNDCDDVQGIMQDYDLAIHTAYQESGPLVLIEYLAQQLPFVAFKTGEVSTQIQSIIPDFFMDNFEIQQWIGRIEAILNKRDLYKDSMRHAFSSLYSGEAYYKKCMGIYSRMTTNG